MSLKTWDGTQWVDTAAAHIHDTYLQLIGGSMTGDITLVGDPTQPLHPATKQYVDGLSDGLHTIATEAPAGPNVGDVWVNPDAVDENAYLPLLGGSMTGAILLVDGSAVLPALAFVSEVNTGMYLNNTNQLAFAVGGALALRINEAVVSVGGNVTGKAMMPWTVAGTAEAPAYSFSGDTDTGMYRVQSNVPAIAAGGQLSAQFGYGAWIYPGASTTGSSANLHLSTSDDRIRRSTSARKYKSNIQDGAALADLILEPVTFYRDDDDDDFIGFIADDMPDNRAIVFDADGEVENYDIRAVVAILAAKVNRLENA